MRSIAFGIALAFAIAGCSASNNPPQHADKASNPKADAPDLGSPAARDLASVDTAETVAEDLGAPLDLTPPVDLSVATVVSDDPVECARLGQRGECVGSVVRWCSIHLVFARDCAAAGQACVVTTGASGAVCESR